MMACKCMISPTKGILGQLMKAYWIFWGVRIKQNGQNGLLQKQCQIDWRLLRPLLEAYVHTMLLSYPRFQTYPIDWMYGLILRLESQTSSITSSSLIHYRNCPTTACPSSPIWYAYPLQIRYDKLSYSLPVQVHFYNGTYFRFSLNENSCCHTCTW
jgi:hypothetical protein